MMKRKLLILSVFVICLATLATGTLAYFHAEGTAHNVITTGGVQIELREWADAAKTTPFADRSGILPGMAVTKIAEVKNTGVSEAWIRVRVTKTIRLAGGGTPDPSLLGLDLNTGGWTLHEDGWLYYDRALKPGEVTAAIFTTVTFPGTLGNEYRNAEAAVDVRAQAVQTANNGTLAHEAHGWPQD